MILASGLTTEVGHTLCRLRKILQFVLKLNELLDTFGRRWLLKQVVHPCLELIDIVSQRKADTPES